MAAALEKGVDEGALKESHGDLWGEHGPGALMAEDSVLLV